MDQVVDELVVVLLREVDMVVEVFVVDVTVAVVNVLVDVLVAVVVVAAANCLGDHSGKTRSRS